MHGVYFWVSLSNAHMFTTLITNEKGKVLYISFRIAKIRYDCLLKVSAVFLKCLFTLIIVMISLITLMRN